MCVAGVAVLTIILCVAVHGPGDKVGQQKDCLEPALMEEDKEEEISGAQFLFETVIRSLTLEEAPDHRPPRRGHPNHQKPMSKYTSVTFSTK